MANKSLLLKNVKALTIAVFGLISMTASSNVLFTTLHDPIVEDDGSCFGAGDKVAIGFKTPITNYYRITGVKVHFKIQPSESPVPFSIDLYDDSGGLPGSRIARIGTGAGTFMGEPTHTLFDLDTESPIWLEQETIYWVVASSDETVWCSLGWDDGGSDPANNGSIFQFVDDARFNVGSGWMSIDGMHQIEINSELSESAETNLWVSRSTFENVPVYNPCTQENMFLSGDLQVLTRKNIDANGKYHLSFRDHFSNVSGQGEYSGSTYRLVGGYDTSEPNTIMTPYQWYQFTGPQVFTRVTRTQILPTGKDHLTSKMYFSVHQSFRVNANDELKVVKWETSFSCSD